MNTNLKREADRLRVLRDAATPGPWAANFGEAYSVTAPDKGRVCICTNLKGAHGMGGRRTGDEVAANARLMAAAHDMMALIDRLQAQNAKLRTGLILAIRDWCDANLLDDGTDRVSPYDDYLYGGSEPSAQGHPHQGCYQSIFPVSEPPEQAAPEPCCGNPAQCQRPCTPRGEWIAEQRARQAEPSVPDDTALHRKMLWLSAPAFEGLGYRLHIIENARFAIVPRVGNSQYREGWNACRAAMLAAAALNSETKS